MPASTSRLSYCDCFDLFDKAITDAIGTRVRVKDESAAIHLKSRLHYARKLDRDENKDVYEIGDPLYAKSRYDTIKVSSKPSKGSWWVYLERIDATIYEVESLNGIDESPPSDNGSVEGEAEEVQSLEAEARRA